MNPTRKEITKDNVSYAFRLPTAKDMIQIDVKALQLRQGLTEGLGVAFSYSHGISMLNQLCEQPSNVTFEELPFHTVDELSSEVAGWIDSFRTPLEKRESKATVDSGQSN